MRWKKSGWLIVDEDECTIARILACRKEDERSLNLVKDSPELYEELKYAVDCIECGLMPNEKWLERAKDVITRCT